MELNNAAELSRSPAQPWLRSQVKGSLLPARPPPSPDLATHPGRAERAPLTRTLFRLASKRKEAGAHLFHLQDAKRKPKSPWFSAEKSGYRLQTQEVPAFLSCPQLKLESIYSQHSRASPPKSLYRVLADFYPFPNSTPNCAQLQEAMEDQEAGIPPTPSPAHAGKPENLVLQKSRGRRLRVVCGWGQGHANAPAPCRTTEHIPASKAGCLQEQ